MKNSTQTTHFNPIAFEHRCKFVLSHLKNCKGRLLDLGCGNGLLFSHLRDTQLQLTGVDIVEEQLELAKKNNPNATFVAEDVCKYSSSEKFDVVTSLDVIEHLYDPESYLLNIKRLLKNDGILILTTPYYGYIKNLLIALSNGWDKHHMPNKLHGHIKLHSLNTMTELLTKTGFEILEYSGLGRCPFLRMMHGVVAKVR